LPPDRVDARGVGSPADGFFRFRWLRLANTFSNPQLPKSAAAESEYNTGSGISHIESCALPAAGYFKFAR
jgi:hypothetical protein